MSRRTSAAASQVLRTTRILGDGDKAQLEGLAQAAADDNVHA
jgi:hypothetical protein